MKPKNGNLKPESGNLKKAPAPKDLMAALKEAGYALVKRFSRKGNRLTVYLTPATLLGEAGNFRALETCAALELQGECRVHAACPQDMLILSVTLVEEPPKGGTTNI